MSTGNNEKIYVSFDAALKFALLETARREMETLPTEEELKEMYPDTSEWDKRILPPALKLLKPKRRPIKMAKRVLIAVMILVCLFSATMMVSAEVRTAVVNTIIEWTGIDIGIRFQIEGTPLARLPDGYREHYVPEGFVLIPELSSDGTTYFAHTYMDAEGKYIDISVGVIENASERWLDNEYTTYDNITFNGVTAYLGQFTDIDGNSGCRMVWAKDGIEHTVEAYTSLSEMFKIVESIK